MGWLSYALCALTEVVYKIVILYKKEKEIEQKMVIVFLTLQQEQRKELKEHLQMNGHCVNWLTPDIIDVDEDEEDWVKTILYDRKIRFFE